MDKRQTILIVDDAEFNRDILKEILGENYNYLDYNIIVNCFCKVAGIIYICGYKPTI